MEADQPMPIYVMMDSKDYNVSSNTNLINFGQCGYVDESSIDQQQQVSNKKQDDGGDDDCTFLYEVPSTNVSQQKPVGCNPLILEPKRRFPLPVFTMPQAIYVLRQQEGCSYQLVQDPAYVQPCQQDPAFAQLCPQDPAFAQPCQQDPAFAQPCPQDPAFAQPCQQLGQQGFGQAESTLETKQGEEKTKLKIPKPKAKRGPKKRKDVPEKVKEKKPKTKPNITKRKYIRRKLRKFGSFEDLTDIGAEVEVATERQGTLDETYVELLNSLNQSCNNEQPYLESVQCNDHDNSVDELEKENTNPTNLKACIPTPTMDELLQFEHVFTHTSQILTVSTSQEILKEVGTLGTPSPQINQTSTLTEPSSSISTLAHPEPEVPEPACLKIQCHND